MTAILMYILKYTMRIRVTEFEEPQGLDKSQHGEAAYFEYENVPKITS